MKKEKILFIILIIAAVSVFISCDTQMDNYRLIHNEFRGKWEVQSGLVNWNPIAVNPFYFGGSPVNAVGFYIDDFTVRQYHDGDLVWTLDYVYSSYFPDGSALFQKIDTDEFSRFSMKVNRNNATIYPVSTSLIIYNCKKVNKFSWE